MLERVISGGQAGADRAGWRAAEGDGIPTGGAMPPGFMAEDGCHPEVAEELGARELESDSYRARTEANVRASDSTLWLGFTDSPDCLRALIWCEQLGQVFRAS